VNKILFKKIKTPAFCKKSKYRYCKCCDDFIIYESF